MHNLLRKKIVILAVIFPLMVSGQIHPNFLKYKIGKSGCESFFPENPGTFSERTDMDSAKYWEAEVRYNGYLFGLVLKDSKPGKNLDYNLSDQDYQEFQASYMSALAERLKFRLGAITPTPIIWDKPLTSLQYVLTGSLEFKSGEGKSVVARTWVEGEKRAILYIIGDSQPLSKGIADTFLFGFRFP